MIRGVRRVVVIGGGPKALFALEELAACVIALGEGAPAFEITVVDPAQHPGTGSAYAEEQPTYLRLNADASILRAAPNPIESGIGSFTDWISNRRAELATEQYPPRALVGSYLIERWSACAAAWQRLGSLTHLRGRATSVSRMGAGWSVQITADASGAPAGTVLQCDDLLIATGHAVSHPGALKNTWRGRERLVPSVFPAPTALDCRGVPPGARVAVRGAALTFIDAALMLTQGRGGRFIPNARGSGLVHHRGDDEPAVLMPTARNGLLLHPKRARHVTLPDEAREAIRRARRRLSTGGGPRPVPDVIDIVTQCAAAILRTAAPDAADAASLREEVEQTLLTSYERDLPPAAGRAERALRREISIAEGAHPPGPARALGYAWSGLYREITRSLRGSDANAEGWSLFRQAAATLERFAFGPPLINAHKLLAMIDSGAVDLRWLDAGTHLGPRTITATPDGSEPVDIVIDAVLAPPGIRQVDEPVYDALLEAGHIHTRVGRRGAVVDDDATAIGTDGRRVEDLALIGRPTEDHVIGHDTLDRTLHNEIGLWAHQLTRKALAHASTP